MVHKWYMVHDQMVNLFLRCKITLFSLYIYAREICFLAYFRNTKKQRTEIQHVAYFVSYFETFRILFFYFLEQISWIRRNCCFHFDFLYALAHPLGTYKVAAAGDKASPNRGWGSNAGGVVA